MKVRRVYFWTDWLEGVKRALKELWRSLFGCHHDWYTKHFRHIQDGFVAVNECEKCGASRPFFAWSGTWADGPTNDRLLWGSDLNLVWASEVRRPPL